MIACTVHTTATHNEGAPAALATEKESELEVHIRLLLAT
jgi:hypothetical protein